MKRALAIAVALCTLGVAGFSQISGKWTADFCIATPLVVNSSLTLNYAVAGFTFGSISKFDSVNGFTSQQFTMKGAFGPFTLTGNMYFNPVTPAYTKADVTTGFDFGGIALTLKVEHWATAQSFCPNPPYAPGPNLRYTLTGTLAPITLKVIFIDCCTGTQFYQLVATLKGLGLCCGITYDAEFSFLKTGFDYLKFDLKNFAQICCGISFDLSVKFTTTAKTVSVTPKFAGFGVAGCFEIYGDLLWYQDGDIYIEGWRIDGWKISCSFGDCSSLTFVTFISPEYAANYGYKDFITACGEFEYIEITSCGVGCCGTKWNAKIQVYFGTNGGLFDVTRLVGSFDLPLMSNFTLNMKISVPAATCATSSICFGWTFTF